MITTTTILLSACVLHLLTGCLLLRDSWRKAAAAALPVGCGLSAWYCAWRYYHAYPMLPLHLEPAALIAALSLLQTFFFFRDKKRPYGRAREIILQTVIIYLSLSVLLFPKDFYLPFIRSISIWSHFMLWSSAIGRCLLLAGACESLIFLLYKQWREGDRSRILRRCLGWCRWGFTFLTLSIFSGEMWCYFGWGTPIIWHDPGITTVMALWLYWVGVLHLHHLKLSGRQRALLTLGGGLLLLTLGCHPDLGPLRPPAGLWPAD